jgi:chromosome segregation ATPase
VFGKEYNQVVKQRDDALAELETAKRELKKKADFQAKDKDAAMVRLQKELAEQEKKSAALAAKIEELNKRNESIQAELGELRKAHGAELEEARKSHDNELEAAREDIDKQLETVAAAHKEEVVKLAEERNEAMKAREEVMALPRIRPVMVAPPPILQPVKPAP